MDEADLKLRVDTSSLEQANYSFSQFQRNAQAASGSVRDHASEMDRLTRSIAQMVNLQRETNTLLAAGVTSQRSSTQALDDHISSLTRLNTTLTAANLAYNVFHKTASDGFVQQAQAVQQLTGNYQQLIGTLDQLAQKMAAISQASRPTGVPAIFGSIAPSAQGFGYGGAVAGEIYAALTPALSQVLTPQLQQLYQAIQGQAARSSIDTATLLKGISTGTQAGFGAEGGADMVTKMQHALTDMGQAAEFQRQALHDYGITTRDANEALRQFVTAMGKVQDSTAKTLTISQFGFDPAMFTQTAAARLNPPQGSQAELQQRQAADIARLQAINAQLVDQANAAQVQRTRTFFGLLPAAGSIITGGQYSSGQYEEVRRNLLTQQGTAAGQLGQGNVGGGISGLVSSELALAVNKLSAIVGASPNYGSVVNPTPGDQARTPPQVLQEIEDFSRSTGRFTPQGVQAQLGRAQRRGESLLNTLGTGAPEYDQAKRDVNDSIAFLEQRLKRINDPLQVLADNLDRQTALLSLPANQRGAAGAISQAEQQQFLTTGQRTSPADRLQLTTSLGLQTEAEVKDHLQNLQHEAEYQKQLASAYAAGGADLQKIIAGEKEYQAAKKSGADANQQAVIAIQDVKNALQEMETTAQQTLLRAQQGNVLSGNVAAAGGNPVAQRQAETRNKALTQLDYFNRYNAAAGSGNYADIAQLNKELDQLTQTLGVDLANQNAAARSQTLFTGQQGISGLTSAIGGNGNIQQTQAQIRARQQLQGQGPYTEGQVTQLANQDLQKKTLDSLAALTEEVDARKALLPLEQQHAAAIMAGVPAEKEFADNLKIAADIQKLMTTATKDQLPLIEKINKELVEQAANERKANEAADVARVNKNFQNSQDALGRQINGFYSGGPQGMRLAEQAEPYRQSLIDAGMPAEQADAQAKAMAMMAEKAQDTKTALQDASTTISTTMKSAMSDVVDALTNGIGKAHGFRYALMDAGLAISKLGLDMFVKKPLGTLFDNIASGRGANFNVGNSGISYSSALGSAAGSAFHGLFGGNDSNGPNRGSGLYSQQAPHSSDGSYASGAGSAVGAGVDIFKGSGKEGSSFLGDLFGGNKSWLGRKINGTSTSADEKEDKSTGGAGGGPTNLSRSTSNATSGSGDPVDLVGTSLRPPRGSRAAAAVASPGSGTDPNWAGKPPYGSKGFPLSGGTDQMGASPEDRNSTFDSNPFKVPAEAGDTVYHNGGLVIRRFHEGDFIEPPGAYNGLAHDEVPAILQVGERVLNRQETAMHDRIFPDGISKAMSGGVMRGATGEYPLGRNDRINSGAGPIGEALLGAGAGGAVGIARGAIAGGIMGDITGAMANPISRLGVQTSTEGLTSRSAADFALRDATAPVSTIFGNPAVKWGLTGAAAQGTMWNPGGMGNKDFFKGGTWGSFAGFHNGGLVRRFHEGGDVSVLDQMLGDDDKRSLPTWAGGPNLGAGGTFSGVGPEVGKITQSRGEALLSAIGGKIEGALGGLKGAFGGGDSAGVGGDSSGGDAGGWAGGFGGESIAHSGGLIGTTRFPRRFHEGGLAANEMPSILSMLAARPAQSPPPAVATGKGQPGNVVVHQNIYTQDAASFRSSADQTAAAAHAAHSRAMRNT